MSADKEKRTVTKEEIREYLDGKVKGRAAHDLERHMLEDPFDHDAMDGFSLLEAEELNHDLTVLENKLGYSKDQRHHYPLRFAATVSILLVAGLAVWFTLDQYSQPSNEMSMKTPIEKPLLDSLKVGKRASIQSELKPNTEDQEKMGVEEEVNVDNKPTAYSGEAVIQKEPRRRQQEVADMVAPSARKTAPEVLMDKGIEVSQDILEEEVMVVSSEDLMLENLAMSQSSEKAKKKVEMGRVSSARYAAGIAKGRFISGEVTNEEGNPLPGVSVVEQGTTNGVITDINGKYTLAVSEDQAMLLFAFVGMKTEEINVDTSGEVNLKMEADVMALSEVVVTSYGQESEEPVRFEQATPIGGLSAFKDYLEEALVYPLEALENQTEGKVLLYVTILKDGSIGEVEVKKSLGNGCDKEATRLIKEGPSWTAAQRDGQAVESDVRLKVKFKIP